MSSARDRIAEEARSMAAAGVEWAKFGGEYPDFDAYTDRILAIVREALLSDDVIYAATDGLSLGVRDVYARDEASRVVEAALDAAFPDHD